MAEIEQSLKNLSQAVSTLEDKARGIVPGTTEPPRSADASVVTSGDFQSEPQIDVLEQSPTIQGEGLSAQVDSMTGTVEQTVAEQTAAQAQTLGMEATDAVQDFISTLKTQPTESELAAAAENEQIGALGQSFNEVKVELNDINSQIRAEQRSLQNKVREIEKNPLGGTREQVQGLIEKEKTKSIRRQADLAVTQQAILGKFSIAKDIADRAVDAQLERQQLNLDVKKFVAEKNWELFTTAEQRAFETQIAQEEREFQTMRTDMKALENAKIEAMRMAQMNNAPTSVLKAIQSAQSPEEVYSVGGQYASVDILDRQIKQEQLDDLRKEPENLTPTSVIDQGGRKLLINTQTGEVIKDFGVTTEVDTNELAMAAQENKITQMDELKSHEGLYKAVGPTALGRFTPFRADVTTGKVNDFIGSVDKMTKALTLDNLVRAKDQGATFGALSDSELKILSDSASKINSWRRTDENGNTTHYEAAEEDFLQEIDEITNYAKLDAYLKGSDPSSIGLVVTDDGKVWSQNSDGTLEQIR